MTQFDYKFQNPLGFACLMVTRTIAIFAPLGIKKLNKKRKTNWIVVVVKWRNRESCLSHGLLLLFQSESSCQTIEMVMYLICLRIQSSLPFKCIYRIILKRRQVASRDSASSNCWIRKWLDYFSFKVNYWFVAMLQLYVGHL